MTSLSGYFRKITFLAGLAVLPFIFSFASAQNIQPNNTKLNDSTLIADRGGHGGHGGGGGGHHGGGGSGWHGGSSFRGHGDHGFRHHGDRDVDYNVYPNLWWWGGYPYDNYYYYYDNSYYPYYRGYYPYYYYYNSPYYYYYEW